MRGARTAGDRDSTIHDAFVSQVDAVEAGPHDRADELLDLGCPGRRVVHQIQVGQLLRVARLAPVEPT